MQDLDTVHGLGDKKLIELRTLGEKVALSTSERGGKALRATITSMEDAWNLHLATVGEWLGEDVGGRRGRVKELRGDFFKIVCVIAFVFFCCLLSVDVYLKI